MCGVYFVSPSAKRCVLTVTKVFDVSRFSSLFSSFSPSLSHFLSLPPPPSPRYPLIDRSIVATRLCAREALLLDDVKYAIQDNKSQTSPTFAHHRHAVHLRKTKQLFFLLPKETEQQNKQKKLQKSTRVAIKKCDNAVRFHSPRESFSFGVAISTTTAQNIANH